MKKIRSLSIICLLIYGIIFTSLPTFAVSNEEMDLSEIIDLSDDIVNLSELAPIDSASFNANLEDKIEKEHENTKTIYSVDENGNVIIKDDNLSISKNSNITIQKIEVTDIPIRDDESEIQNKSTLPNKNSSKELMELTNVEKSTDNRQEASEHGDTYSLLESNVLKSSMPKVARGLPDLAVTYAYVTDEIDALYDYPWPSHVTIPFQVRVDNIGNAAASIVHIDVLADGRTIRSDDFGKLEIGEGWTIDYSFGAGLWGAGTHTITFVVNQNRVITESNFNNNTGAEVDREFVNVVDLRAKEIKLDGSSDTCKALERVEFVTTVSNIGKKDRQLPFDVGVYAYGANVINHIMDDLPAGYKRDFRFTAIFNGHNTKTNTLELKVDKSNKLGKTEVNKENNNVNGTVYVDYADETYPAKWEDSENIQVCVLPDAVEFLETIAGLSKSDITNAIKKWNGITNRLKITNVYFADSPSNENHIPVTTYYDDKKPSTYAHAVAYYDDPTFEYTNVHTVEINTAAWDNWQKKSKAVKTGVLTHEIGHLMGIRHSGLTGEEIAEDDPDKVDCIDPAIMYCYRSSDPRSSNVITAHDKANIKYKYGN